MSGLIQGRLEGRALTPAEMAVAKSFGNRADDDGSNAYPSIALVAWSVRKTPRTVQRIIRRLERLGVLVLEHEGGGRGNTNRYVVYPDAVRYMQRPCTCSRSTHRPYCLALQNDGSELTEDQFDAADFDARMTPLGHHLTKGDTTVRDSERVTSTTGKGDIPVPNPDTHDTKGCHDSVTQLKAEPSTEPPKETSTIRSAIRSLRGDTTDPIVITNPTQPDPTAVHSEWWSMLTEVFYPCPENQQTRWRRLIRDKAADHPPEEIRRRAIAIATAWGPEALTINSLYEHWEWAGSPLATSHVPTATLQQAARRAARRAALEAYDQKELPQ